MENRNKRNKRNTNPPTKGKQPNILDIFKPVDKNAVASAKALEASAIDTESGLLRFG